MKYPNALSHFRNSSQDLILQKFHTAPDKKRDDNVFVM